MQIKFGEHKLKESENKALRVISEENCIMRSFIVCTLLQRVIKMEEDEIGGACSSKF
jgi:hypothetical protein